MHEHRRKKEQKVVHAKARSHEINRKHQQHDVRSSPGPECALTLSPERWSRDPFDSFPINMQPYMHELVYVCKSTHAADETANGRVSLSA